jgi:hypothetical protein
LEHFRKFRLAAAKKPKLRISPPILWRNSVQRFVEFMTPRRYFFVVYVVALDCGFCADWDGDGGMERDGPNLWVQIPGAICGILAGFNLL